MNGLTTIFEMAGNKTASEARTSPALNVIPTDFAMVQNPA
jgi:hypothetical protein